MCYSIFQLCKFCIPTQIRKFNWKLKYRFLTFLMGILEACSFHLSLFLFNHSFNNISKFIPAAKRCPITFFLYRWTYAFTFWDGIVYLEVVSNLIVIWLHKSYFWIILVTLFWIKIARVDCRSFFWFSTFAVFWLIFTEYATLVVWVSYIFVHYNLNL